MTKEEACKVISDNKKEIDRLSDECIDLSNEHGVPFVLSNNGVRKTYIPKGAVKVADPDYLGDVHYIDVDGNKVYGDGYEDENSGWIHSDIC